MSGLHIGYRIQCSMPLWIGNINNVIIKIVRNKGASNAFIIIIYRTNTNIYYTIYTFVDVQINLIYRSMYHHYDLIIWSIRTANFTDSNGDLFPEAIPILLIVYAVCTLWLPFLLQYMLDSIFISVNFLLVHLFICWKIVRTTFLHHSIYMLQSNRRVFVCSIFYVRLH